MVMADCESPYKKGKAYSKSDVQLLVVKLSIVGLSGIAQGSMSSGRSYKLIISVHEQKEQ